MCMPGTYEGCKRALDPLELNLQQLKAPLPEDLNVDSQIHVVWHTEPCDSSSKRNSKPLASVGTHMFYIYLQTDPYSSLKKEKKKY